MLPKKNGVDIHFGGGHVYSGDAFQCPQCEQEVVHTAAVARHEPNYNADNAYLKMEG